MGTSRESQLDLSAAAYDRLRERIAAWADTQPNVRAAVVVGSRARTDHPVDRWADLDVVLFVTDPRPLLAGGSWLDAIDEVWLRTRYATAGDVPEWIVTYAEGRDVDFVIAPVARLREPVTAQVFSRGMRILVDKDGHVARMWETVGTPTPLPPLSQDQFTDLCERFWVVADRVARKVARGEMFVALIWLAQFHERGVLPMLAWHARASHHGRYDTWYAGRLLEEWGDPRAREALGWALPGYGRAEVAWGLLGTAELFGCVAAETAERLGYAYPPSRWERAFGLIRDLLAAVLPLAT